MCGICSTARNASVVMQADGKVAGVLSWDGFHRAMPAPKKMSEDQILARALYLEKHGFREEADELLELYLAGYNVSQ